MKFKLSYIIIFLAVFLITVVSVSYITYYIL